MRTNINSRSPRYSLCCSQTIIDVPRPSLSPTPPPLFSSLVVWVRFALRIFQRFSFLTCNFLHFETHFVRSFDSWLRSKTNATPVDRRGPAQYIVRKHEPATCSEHSLRGSSTKQRSRSSEHENCTSPRIAEPRCTE